MWNLLSALRLSISYQVTKDLLKNKLERAWPRGQPINILIMAADNNDCSSKQDNRGARDNMKVHMVHTVQRLTRSVARSTREAAR